MNPLGEIMRAAAGINRLAARRPDAGSKFNLTGAGLSTALALYVTLVLATIVVQIAARRSAALDEIAIAMLANLLPILGLTVVAVISVRALNLGVSTYALLVPSLYALVLMLILSIIISLTVPTLSPIALGMMAYLLFRIGMGMARMNIGIALAYSALNLVVLVALPLSLYMLFSPMSVA